MNYHPETATRLPHSATPELLQLLTSWLLNYCSFDMLAIPDNIARDASSVKSRTPVESNGKWRLMASLATPCTIDHESKASWRGSSPDKAPVSCHWTMNANNVSNASSPAAA